MTAALDVREDHAAILLSVLRAHLPSGARAYVFGSRAHGGARPFSDLDLALEWDRPLGLDILGRISEALSESDLPYKVDIVDLAIIDLTFRSRITADCIPLEVSKVRSARDERRPAGPSVLLDR
jgi:predicted nucleotidyltransferase